MESIFEGLIEFESREELTEFIKTIDKKSSLDVIGMALEHAHKSGIYSIEETHIIYLCLSKLKENENNNVHNCSDNGNSNS